MNPLVVTDAPDNKFCALNRDALARTSSQAVTASSSTASAGCQKGTLVADSLVIILTGDVNGNRLNTIASGLLGVWINVLMNISGMIMGRITTVVN